MLNHQHLVFGAGLIGAYLGSALQLAGINVALVCRPAVKNKLAQGMTLGDYQGNQAGPIALTFVERAEQLPQAVNVLWLTVKCTGLSAALAEMAAFIGTNTLILCCQNGLGSDVRVKQAFPHNQVLRVMVPFNVVELRSGYYHRGSQGELTIERPTTQTELIDSLVNQINSLFLPAKTCTDMTALLWAKLQLNLANSVNALADIPVKAMLEQRDYRRVIALLMRELLCVVDNLAIDLPRITALPASWLPNMLVLPDFIFKRIANKMLAIDPTVRTSMWWDLSQGKPTEIDFLNGAVVHHGQTLNIACPANQRLVQLIKHREAEAHSQQQLMPLDGPTLLRFVQQHHH